MLPVGNPSLRVLSKPWAGLVLALRCFRLQSEGHSGLARG
jgi:hypothetical protein